MRGAILLIATIYFVWHIFILHFERVMDRKNPEQSGNVRFVLMKIFTAQIVRDAYGRSIENDYYVWIMNWYPRYEGHTMVVPKKRVCSFEAAVTYSLCKRITVSRTCATGHKASTNVVSQRLLFFTMSSSLSRYTSCVYEDS